MKLDINLAVGIGFIVGTIIMVILMKMEQG